MSRDSTRPATQLRRWCATFESRCRARGLRVTPQRTAVYEALARDTGHPTAEAVHARLRSHLPSLSPATVYRILESLEREGLVRRVSTTDGVGRFDANMTDHQHLVCRVCGRIGDLSAPTLAGLPARVGAVRGFVVEGLDIRIVGRCQQCRPGPRQRQGTRGRARRPRGKQRRGSAHRRPM